MTAAQGRLSDRAEYPKDCPNCGLWLTAESMDCPRCMAKLSPSSGAGSVGRSGDTDGLLPEGLVSPPASDSPAAQRHERFVDRVQGFAKLLPEYDLTDPEDARSVRRVLIDLALAAHLIEVEADPDASE